MSQILNIYRQSFSSLQRNVWILAIAMFINRSGSMVLLFTSLYMTNILHFTIGEAGTVMSLYGIGSVLGSYSGGWLTDRRSYFDIMILSLIVSGLILLSMLFVTSIIGLSIVVFFYAFSADVFRPANSKAIAIYSDASNRTRSVSLVRLAVNLGFTVGPAIGGFIALYLGYKWLFAIDAITSFGAAALLYMYLPRQQIQHSEHRSTVLNDSSSSAYRDFRYLIFILLVAVYATSFFQIFASIPQYFSKICHYGEDTIGLLMALNGFLVVLIEMPLIMTLEKHQENFKYIIIGVSCLPVCFAILLFGKGLMIWAILYTVVITFSEIFAMPFMMNYAISRPVKERQGQYSALYSIAYGLANIAAPIVGLGIAYRYGFEKMFYLLIGISMLTLIGFSLLKKYDTVLKRSEVDS